MGKKLLEALNRKNRGLPPIWLMRQAGRYLPEYRALRERHSLYDLFFTPHLAAEVTLMPLKRYPLDAAILFSDITAIVPSLGLDLTFNEGPTITPIVTKKTALPFFPEKLEPIFSAIDLLQPVLRVPLIGFCGGPFTVATYLCGGIEKTVFWMRREPQSFSLLIKRLEEVSLYYLKGQVKRGVEAIQIFDSWANVLTKEEFMAYCLPFVEKVCKEISVPKIFFMRNLVKHLSLLQLYPLALSIDEETPLRSIRKNTDQPLQGNLSCDLLFSPLEEIQAKTEEILDAMEGDLAFIFNLGHGVKPKTPLESINAIFSVFQKRGGGYDSSFTSIDFSEMEPSGS